jgi:hypothetical protein
MTPLKMTALELATRLEGDDAPRAPALDEKRGDSRSRSLFGKVSLRAAFCASLLVGMVALESRALAKVGTIGADNTITSLGPGPVSPADAYNFGYSFGQAGISFTGATGNPALDEALTNGNIDGLEGLPASPPGPAPPPGQSLNENLAPETTPTQAYDLGFELGDTPGIDAVEVGVEGDPAAVDGFADGFSDAVSGDAFGCASTCGAACATSCASCASCASCGGGGGGCGGCG